MNQYINFLVALIVLSLAFFCYKSKKKIHSCLEQLEREKKSSKELVENYAAEKQELEEVIKEMKAKYAGILSLEDAINSMREEADFIQLETLEIRNTYSEKRQLLDKLEEQLSIYDERLSFVELGVYEPHFDYKDTEEFKASIIDVREQQKLMISEKTATLSSTNWVVEGSAAKGKTMINRQIRLTLRAFNNECDVAIANVRWNNANAMEKRILSAAKALNKENATLCLCINVDYVMLKLEELRLTHEYREKLKLEKEQRSELARAEREEKKLIADAEAAEREEHKFQLLLEKARQEVSKNDLDAKAQERIFELEKALKEAHHRSERARAMAEMTKSGYVYIISNIGSFGQDVFKIGLTRRLEPDDRVRELGDASVPFSFDIHAMIYSDDAPDLESALHREFADRRINMSNLRKEFFKVSLEEVEAAVAKLAPQASFFKDREAQEWHETIAKRNQLLSKINIANSKLPLEI